MLWVFVSGNHNLLVASVTDWPLSNMPHAVSQLDKGETQVPWCVQGHYGEVLKGKYTDENGRVQEVAIKRLKQNMYEKFATEFEKEFRIMVKLDHDNVVHIIGQSVERKLLELHVILTNCKNFTCIQIKNVLKQDRNRV